MGIDELHQTVQRHIDAWRRCLPLTADEKQQLHANWVTLGAYDSCAIEGNSLTAAETEVVLWEGATISGKPLRDHLEVVDHAMAQRAVLTELAVPTDDEPEVTVEIMLRIHEIAMWRSAPDIAGRLRTVRVMVTGDTRQFPPPEDVLPALQRRFSVAESELHGDAPENPYVQAARRHLQIVDVHPFRDGNGRTARLVMNLMLARRCLPPLRIPVARRADYIEAVREGCQMRYEKLDRLVLELAVAELQNVLSFVTEKPSRGRPPLSR